MSDVKQKVEEAKKSIDFSKNSYTVHLETSEGKINIELYPDVAPNHCKNIIALADVGFYNGIKFHRVIKEFVIQVGCPNGNGTVGAGYAIDAEFNDKLHELGVLSMARTQDPNSAGSQFFLCLGRLPHLDNQYTVFGKASDEESLQVVQKIGSVTTGVNDQPTSEILINQASVKTQPL